MIILFRDQIEFLNWIKLYICGYIFYNLIYNWKGKHINLWVRNTLYFGLTLMYKTQTYNYYFDSIMKFLSILSKNAYKSKCIQIYIHPILTLRKPKFKILCFTSCQSKMKLDRFKIHTSRYNVQLCKSISHIFGFYPVD